ncbi:hypothetical protein [Gynurincola endophyticus]|uniref:hypothetical protein n=1 Tax=Gynurincola endophyticus TaxID=2479004 RepID=UPI000F8CB90D|nr:hypothetical protein [Gynurincola endophyticus]
MKKLTSLLLIGSLFFQTGSLTAQNAETDSLLNRHFTIWKQKLMNGAYTEYYQFQAYEFFIRAKLKLPNATASASDMVETLNDMRIQSVDFKVISRLYQSDNAEYYTGYEVLKLDAGIFGAGEFEAPIIFIRSPNAPSWKFFYLNEATLPHLKKVLPNAPKEMIIPEEKGTVMSDQSWK